jgi:hypothetical protein
MRKYIPKFTGGGTTDPLHSDRNNVRVQPIGSYSAVKKQKQAQAELSGKEIEKYTRDQYREDKRQNKVEMIASGNPVGLKSDKAKSITSGIASGLSTATNLASNFIDVDEDSNFAGQQAVGDALMSSGNPYAMAAGAAFKALSAIDQVTGFGINTIDKNQASDVGLSKGQRLLNNVLGFFPGNPIAAIASTKTSKADQMTAETASLSGAFGGSVGDISTAGTMGDNRYLFGGSKINSFIDKANRDNKLLTEMSMTNTQRKQSNYGSDLAQQNINRYAGNTYNSNRIGKHGLKLMSINEIKQLLALRKESEIQSFQNGGIIGVDINVIAEGKYHAHRNHLEEISDDLSDLTKKGIPVVAHSEGGEIEQIAEIEKKELIFILEVTQKLEELYKDGSEEAMIEAGKLVALEIMENTQDNSGEVLANE